MLENHTASAVGSVNGKYIMQLKVDDVVFLYGNKDGIIAYGIADTTFSTKVFAYENIHDREYYVHLNNFRILKTPMTFSEMEDITTELQPQNTMYSIRLATAIRFIEEINQHHV